VKLTVWLAVPLEIVKLCVTGPAAAVPDALMLNVKVPVEVSAVGPVLVTPDTPEASVEGEAVTEETNPEANVTSMDTDCERPLKTVIEVGALAAAVKPSAMLIEKITVAVTVPLVTVKLCETVPAEAVAEAFTVKVLLPVAVRVVPETAVIELIPVASVPAAIVTVPVKAGS
jgi:hypothetical protein